MTRDEVLREFEEPVSWVQRQRMADEIVQLREQLQQQAAELLQERERLATVDAERDQFASMLYDCENEREGLRHRLDAVEAERDALKKTMQHAETIMQNCQDDWDRDRAILAALREPSEVVKDAAYRAFDFDVPEDMYAAIRAAVAAAEREVGA